MTLLRKVGGVLLVVVVAFASGCQWLSAGHVRPSAAPRLPRPAGEEMLGSVERRKPPRPPIDWLLGGSNPDGYKGSVVRTVGLDTVGVSLKSRRRLARSFASFYTRIDADPYRGQRVQVRAKVGSNGLRNWAGLWMRIDAGRETIAFDNMHERPLRGTTAPRLESVTLDVTQDADSISYGLLLAGGGSVTAEDLELVVVSASVPVADSRH